MSNIDDQTTNAVCAAIEAGMDRDGIAKVCVMACLDYLRVNPPWIVKAEIFEEAFNAEILRVSSKILQTDAPKGVSLTKRQKELFNFINEYMRAHDGAAPSFNEMFEYMGLASKGGIHRLLTGLQERGAIRRLPNRARAIEILRAL
jgi:hypothetical protein